MTDAFDLNRNIKQVFCMPSAFDITAPVFPVLPLLFVLRGTTLLKRIILNSHETKPRGICHCATLKVMNMVIDSSRFNVDVLQYVIFQVEALFLI